MSQLTGPQEAEQRVINEAQEKTGRLNLAGLKNLKRLPPTVRKLSHLVVVNISKTQINSLAELEGLSALRQIDCHQTEVSDLRPIAELKELQSLICYNTKITDLTPIAGLLSLTTLDCAINKLSDLSPLMGLSELESLDCAATKVVDLSPLAKLAKLKSLYCWSTDISDFKVLGGLLTLRSIDCSQTKIENLNWLSSLPDLTSLICNRTEISDLTPLVDLSSLQRLDISSTQVEDLSPLAGANHLVILKIANLSIAKFPKSLLYSPTLKELFFENGSLEGVASEILSQHNCLIALQGHFEDLNVGAELLPDVKVMVLGNGRIGKTQLCRQLKGELYERDAESTHGILVSSTNLGNDRIHLWDFGGQDLYHGTHALFMKTRAVFIVLWTPDSENQREHQWQEMSFRNHRLDYWLELVAAQGGSESPLLIVQGRCDTPEVELRLPPANPETLERFPSCKILHHSSATPRGLEALRESVSDAIQWMRQKQGTVFIGAGRLRVKRRLEALRDADAKRNPAERVHRLISQEFFHEICEEEKGVSDPHALVSYLHQTGIVFYQPGLFDDRIILDQGWALEAIYTVFHREKCWRQIRIENGRFTRTLLEAFAWQQYSLNEQKLFLSMMESCGICFIHRKLDNGEHEYIAPDLLPPEEEFAEVLAIRWGDDGPDQAYEYEIPHEHPGLMTKVISTVGALAGIDALYWKGGFWGYEKHTRSKVRIRETSDPLEKELRFSVETKDGDAHGLIKAIAAALERNALPSVCRQWGKVMESQLLLQVKKGRAPEIIDDPKPTDDNKPQSLEFTELPRTATRYAVSYAWTDESSTVVDELCKRANSRGIDILRDKTELGMGEELTKFMRHLATQDRVFVILSKKYLESPYCMFELLEIWRLSRQDKDEFRKKVRCLALPDADFSSPVQRMHRAVYWKEQFEQLDKLVKEHGVILLGDEDIPRYKRMQDFTHRVGDMLCSMADILHPRTLDELEQHGFDES